MWPAHFKILEDTDDLLLIVDCGPWDRFWTITNDAENVVASLAYRLRGRRLEYIDSDGVRGELLVRDGMFAGFGS